MRQASGGARVCVTTLLALAALAAFAPASPAAPSFGTAVRYSCPGVWELTSVAVGDLNEDGKLDIVGGPGPAWDHPVFWFPGGSPLGTFGPMQGVLMYVPTPSSLTLGRFRGTGSHLDLALTSMTQKALWIVPGNGDATFAAGASYPVGLDPRRVVADDFNGDAVLDVAVVNRNSCTVSYFLGAGDLSFGPQVCFGTGVDPGPVCSADMDHDGLPDLLVTSMSPGAVHSVVMNAATHDFYPRTDVSAPGAITSAVEDFNGDGVPDVAVTSETHMWIEENNGWGTLAPRAETYPASGGCWSMVAADLDHDGNPDLIRANLSDSTISIWPGKGDGRFGARNDYVVGEAPWALAVADVDQDGDLDIVVGCNAEPHHVAVLLNHRIVVGVETPVLPAKAALLPPRPNPSRAATTFAFDLPTATHASVMIADVQGRVVRTLAGDESFVAGRSSLTWDGRDAAGRPAAAGVYFVRLKTARGFTDVRRLELVR